MHRFALIPACNIKYYLPLLSYTTPLDLIPMSYTPWCGLYPPSRFNPYTHPLDLIVPAPSGVAYATLSMRDVLMSDASLRSATSKY
jgi:hypothetical protein